MARDLPPGGSAERLDSWKEIAAYLKRNVRTVQRWEKESGLPVHRQGQVGSVYAFKSEIDSWWNSDKRPKPTEDDVGLDPTVEKEYLPDSPPRPRPALLVPLTVTVLIALGVLSWLLIPSPSTSPVRLVVLPFDNLSGDSSQGYFARGISDDLTSEFGKLQSKYLRVVARATAERYREKPLDEIVRDLKAKYVVEGSVRREGERVRMNVELIQLSDQSQIWAENYDEQMPTVSARPAEIATLVDQQIAKRVTPQVPSRVFHWFSSTAPARQTRIGTRNPKAYDDFLLGRYFWSKRGVDSMAKGMSYFHAAIADDPTFAAPYAGLADGLALLGSAQSGMMPPTKAFPEAKAAAEKALSLDDSLPEAHASLAYISLVYDHDLSKAKNEFERAIQLDPSYPTARQWFGLYYEASGDPKGAIQAVTRAKELDSLSLAVNVALAESYYFDRDYDRALEQASAAVELDGNSALAHFNRGRAYLQKKQYDEALADFQEARANSPNPATLVYLGYTYARKGDSQRAKEYIHQLDAAPKSQYVPAIYYAVIYVGLDDKDKAFSWFKKALEERCDYLVFLRQDPMADSLRDDPRFADLLKQIGTPLPN